MRRCGGEILKAARRFSEIAVRRAIRTGRRGRRAHGQLCRPHHGYGPGHLRRDTGNGPIAPSSASLAKPHWRFRGEGCAAIFYRSRHDAPRAAATRRRVNDWTPLHHAVARRDLAAVRLLPAHGADPHVRTRMDELTTPPEDAEAAGFIEAAQSMREAIAA